VIKNNLIKNLKTRTFLHIFNKISSFKYATEWFQYPLQKYLNKINFFIKRKINDKKNKEVLCLNTSKISANIIISKRRGGEIHIFKKVDINNIKLK